ncbi:MAG: hypothetical protein V4488_17510 [Pseudomonadota bacterium]
MQTSPRHLSLIQAELNGGKTTKADIDRLAEAPDACYLSVSGLEQQTLEYLVATYGSRLVALNLWKCPRIESLAPLENLPKLRFIAMYWNQKTDQLWNFSRNKQLAGVRFTDFSKLRSLDQFAEARSVEELEFGHDLSGKKLVFDSLAPLAGLDRLKHLTIGAQGIRDERVEPLGMLSGLQTIHFGTSLFTTEQVAWLRARLPHSVKSSVLDAFRTIYPPIQLGGKAIDTFVVGHRKPSLDSRTDASRIEKYRRDFDAMLEFFTVNREACPADYCIQKA